MICKYAGCISLEKFSIPASVNSIKNGAFQNCEKLDSIIIPEGVKMIENQTFNGCNKLKSISLPNSLNYIKEYSFSGCGFNKLVLPENVKIIYSKAFADCLSLKILNSHAETPPLLYDDTFSNYDVLLIVPEGCVDVYANTNGWKNFANIIDKSVSNLTYVIDGEVYKTYEIEIGQTIVPEPAPEKEGYNFSGWSNIPEIMPAFDVIVYGSFNAKKYLLNYYVDGTKLLLSDKSAK